MTVVLAGLLLCQITACGGGDNEKNNENEEDAPVEIVPAMPGIGIGRVMPQIAEPNGLVVCIDPGHGFVDGGTGEGIFSDGTLEKDITLSIAKKLSEDLIAYGFETILTHNGVDFPPAGGSNSIYNATERSVYANSITMDYFISIHVNSSKNPDAEGIRIYYYDNWIKVNPIGGEVAELMGKKIETNMPDDLDPLIVDQSEDPNTSFVLCREVKYPSSLVEVGFCTNESDAAKMIRDDWQSQLAQSLADGINEYFVGDSD